MSWYYLDISGQTQGPSSAGYILSEYHLRTGAITTATHLWNPECGVDEWTELSKIYSNMVDDVVASIIKGGISGKLLSLMMNPYDIYVQKQTERKHKQHPIGQAKITIEYKGYLIHKHQNNNSPLVHFIENRESVSLGIKKNAPGLEMALYTIREGEQCSIYIPWRLAYGEKGAGNLIPPKTDILFTLKLHAIESQGSQFDVVRFEKWSKMKVKWNKQKEANNLLYNKDKEKPQMPIKQQKNVKSPNKAKVEWPSNNNANSPSYFSFFQKRFCGWLYFMNFG